MDISAWTASLTPKESNLLVFIVIVVGCVCLYVAYRFLSLLWRIPAFVDVSIELATAQKAHLQREGVLVEAQIRYYEVQTKILKGEFQTLTTPH